MTDPTRPTLDHAPGCQRRGVPILRASWDGHAQWFCPSCGRAATADDTRPAPTPEVEP